MKEEEKKPSIFLTGAEEDGPFIRAVAAAFEARGYETELPARLEDQPSIISELIKRAGPILRQMEGSEPIELEERIFLSFSGQDEAIVRAFRTELAHRGVRTCIFTSSLRGVGFGPNWVDGELQALSTCCGFAVFFSSSSIKSTHVIFELDFMLERLKRCGGIFFCAVFVEDLSFLLPETVPVINLYKMGVAEAAEGFIEKAVAFYRSYRDSTPSVSEPS